MICLLRLFLLFDLLAVQVLAARPVNAASPASELAAAVDDLSRNVAPAELQTTRYVSFYYATEQQRAEQRAVLSFVLNSVDVYKRQIIFLKSR